MVKLVIKQFARHLQFPLTTLSCLFYFHSFFLFSGCGWEALEWYLGNTSLRIFLFHTHRKIVLLAICFPFVYFFNMCLYFSLASKPVDLKLCTGPIPNTTQLCHIPCPTECEVSPWSAWGPCTYENCNDQQGKKGRSHDHDMPFIPTSCIKSWIIFKMLFCIPCLWYFPEWLKTINFKRWINLLQW